MKQVADLAIFGGTPAFTEPLHVGYPNIGNREVLLQRFNDMLDRRQFTNMGPYSQELERRIADMLGVKHCITTCIGWYGKQNGVIRPDLKWTTEFTEFGKGDPIIQDHSIAGPQGNHGKKFNECELMRPD